MSSYNSASSSSLSCLAASVNRLSLCTLARSNTGHGGALRMRMRGATTVSVSPVGSLARRPKLLRFGFCGSSIVEDLGFLSSLYPVAASRSVNALRCSLFIVEDLGFLSSLMFFGFGMVTCFASPSLSISAKIDDKLEKFSISNSRLIFVLCFCQGFCLLKSSVVLQWHALNY